MTKLNEKNLSNVYGGVAIEKEDRSLSRNLKGAQRAERCYTRKRETYKKPTLTKKTAAK